jgi:hypothetical protein
MATLYSDIVEEDCNIRTRKTHDSRIQSPLEETQSTATKDFHYLLSYSLLSTVRATHYITEGATPKQEGGSQEQTSTKEAIAKIHPVIKQLLTQSPNR